MPGDCSSRRERSERISNEPRVIAEAGNAGYLTIGGYATARDAAHNRVHARVCRSSAVVSARPARL
jgi:hypothetical protein